MLPPQPGLFIQTLETVEQTVVVNLAMEVTEAACPLCGYTSPKIHSFYQRKIADLNWAAYTIELRIQVRRFWCLNPECSRRIFCERLKQLASAYARRTDRFSQQLGQLALALGGRPAARLALKLKLKASRSTLLRLLKATILPDHPTPRVLGVDDFALKKGNTYATLLVDLEKHQPIEVLPDRTSATLASWLQTHPGVEIVSRDGSRTYAEGISRGAPAAIQVSDRFHLLKNLTRHVHNFFVRKRVWQHSFKVIGIGKTTSSSKSPGTLSQAPDLKLMPQMKEQLAQTENQKQLPSKLSKHQQLQQQRYQQRLERFAAVKELDRQGKSKRQIVRELGMAFETVTKYLQSETAEVVAPMPRQPRASILDPYKDYLWKRWLEEQPTIEQLHLDLTKRGYKGSVGPIRSFLAELRPQPHWGSGPHKLRPTLKEQDLVTKLDQRKLSGREASWLILKKKPDLTKEQRELLKQLLAWDQQVGILHQLTQSFRRMVSFRQSNKLEKWLRRAQESGIEELQSFARGLESDLEAVRAGLSQKYSNGQLEGQVNRIKTIKKQMYGRANFKLLRQRVLAVA